VGTHRDLRLDQLAPAKRTNPLDVAGEEALYRAMRRFWQPVMWADELGDRPAPVRLLDEALVVVRLEGGVSAFRELCVHRGTALSLGWVNEGRLVCAYHGWHYDAGGICTSIPASHGTNIPRKARLVSYQAVEHAGLIWVCLSEEEPPFPLPPFPQWEDTDYRKIKIPTYDWHCSAARRVENFVDFSHFPWVHEGILGDRSNPEVPEHDVVRDATSLSFELGVVEPASPLKGDVEPGAKVQRYPSRYTISMPFTVLLDQPLEAGRHFVLFVASSPLGAKETRNFTWNARNYDLDPSRDREFVEFQQTILEQDRVVVESQRPEELPIDLSEELHIKSVDRVSIDYRRWLGEIAEAELSAAASPSG
jgi:methylxanthine N1-demethylase